MIRLALVPLLAAGQDEIVVSAPRLASIDVGTVFARQCVEADRLTGRFAPPPTSDGWRPLDEGARRRFAIAADPAVGAWGIIEGGRALVLEQSEAPADARAGGDGRVIERRCVLTAVGDLAPDRLAAAMRRLFGGGGTQRHVGGDAGTPVVAGWRQWAWTAIPSRGSRQWRVRARDAYVVVVDRRFYDGAEHVIGELKLREGGGTPVAIMALTHRLVP